MATRFRTRMAITSLILLACSAPFSVFAVDSVQILPPIVDPDNATEHAKLDDILTRAAFAVGQLSRGTMTAYAGATGNVGGTGNAGATATKSTSTKTADRSNTPTYTLQVTVVDQPGSQIMTMALTRRSDGTETQPFVFMSKWTASIDVDIAHAVLYLRREIDGFTESPLAAPPVELATLSSDMLSSADLGASFPLRPVSVSVESNGDMVVGTSVVAIELDRYFREISKPGRELYTQSQTAYAYDVRVTPAGTVVARPGTGGTLYTIFPDGSRPTQVRTGVDLAGGMAVLDDGSVILTDATKPRAVRVSGRRVTPFPISTNPNAFSFSLAAGPDDTLWNWDYSEGRIHIIAANGQELEALVPMLPPDEKGQVRALRVDPTTGNFYLLTYKSLWKFRRDGEEIWRLDSVPVPVPVPFSSIFTFDIDPSRGLVYLLDISNGTIYQLLERGTAPVDSDTQKLLTENRTLLANADDVDAYRVKAAIYHALGAHQLERAQDDAILNIDPGDQSAQAASDAASAAILRTQAAQAAEVAIRTLKSLGPVSAQPSYNTAAGLYEKLIALAPEDTNARSDLARLKQLFTEQNPLSKDHQKATISKIALGPVFPALLQYYRVHPVGSVTVRNTSDSALYHVAVSVSLRYLDYPSEMPAIAKIDPGEEVDVPVLLPLSNSVLDLQEDLPVQAQVTVTYTTDPAGANSASINATGTVSFERNSALTWDDTRKLAAFVTPREEIASLFAFNAVSSGETVPDWSLPDRFYRAMKIVDTLGVYGIQYVEDPNSPFSKVMGQTDVVDTVRFPRTTLRIRSGDCDDTTALLATLLEAAAVPTAIMTSPGHVFLAFDTGEPESNEWMFGSSTRSVIKNGGTLWIPIETTALSRGFYGAWELASNLVRTYYGTAAMEFLPTETAQETYPPVPLPAATFQIVPPPDSLRAASFATSIKRTESDLFQATLSDLTGQLSRSADSGTKIRLSNEVGILDARFGDMSGAQNAFRTILAARPDYVPGYINLANIQILAKDYSAAQKTMLRAREIRPDSSPVNVVLAQIASATGDDQAAAEYLAIVRLNDPGLAERYAYLASSQSRGANQSSSPNILWSSGE